METEHKVVVTGWNRQISFPNYCANCNAPAYDRLPVQRVFTYYEKGERKFVISFKVPFCHSCLELHRKEEVSLTWQNWLVAFLLGGMLIVPAGYILFLSLINLWPDFVEALMSANLILTVIYGALGVLSLCPVILLLIGAKILSEPHLVIPPTSITSAIDFSRDRPRRFSFRHEGYAERFREANRQRLWSPDQSRGGIPWRWIFRLFLLGAVAVVVWWLLMQGVF